MIGRKPGDTGDDEVSATERKQASVDIVNASSTSFKFLTDSVVSLGERDMKDTENGGMYVN